MLKNISADPRFVINSRGESILHLLEKRRFPGPEFFKTFQITEEDLTSKGQASYSPIDRIKEIFSNNLEDCPILYLYPRLFGIELSKVTLYSKVKHDTILGDGSMCIICREEYIDTENVIVGSCKHVVHFECYKQLKSTNCPICRKVMHVEHFLTDDERGASTE